MTSVLVLDQASSEFYGKRLSLFRDFAPRASRVAVLAPASYWRTVYGDALRDAAEGLGFTIVGEPVEDPASQEQSSEHSRRSLPSMPIFW
jgi:hypothetical protein